MFCALLTSRYQVSVYRTNGPLVIYLFLSTRSLTLTCSISNVMFVIFQCMGWTWYLANDMQFYLLSPLIFVALF